MTVRVTAMLCWYDEPVDLLRQAVRGVSVFADRIVAADGAYEFVADKKPRSPAEQKFAIADEAHNHGLEAEFLPPGIWPGQVAKRDAVLQHAKQDSDWVMVLDADWRITGDREPIRDALEQYPAEGAEQVTVNFVQPVNPDRPLEDASANIWHQLEVNQWRRWPLIYRVMPMMHYDREHWALYCVNDAGEKVGLWGGEGNHGYGMAQTANLRAPHLVEHMCLFREEKQLNRNRDYINLRDAEVAKVGFET